MNTPDNTKLETGPFAFIFFIILSIALSAGTALFIVINVNIGIGSSLFAALMGSVALIYVLILSYKKINASLTGQAYAILISGQLLISFFLFYACIINFKLDVH